MNAIDRLPTMVGKIGWPFALQYTSIVINMAIQHIALKMGTIQNDATNMMPDVTFLAWQYYREVRGTIACVCCVREMLGVNDGIITDTQRRNRDKEIAGWPRYCPRADQKL